MLKILDAVERNQAQPIQRSYARQLLTAPKTLTLEGWLRGLPKLVKKKHDRERAGHLAKHCAAASPGPSRKNRFVQVRRPVPHLPAHRQPRLRGSLLEHHRLLSAGKFVNKNNADCVLDDHTRPVLKHLGRDLESMGDHLLSYYGELIAERGMSDMAQVGELPFRWETQYPFAWMGGWLHNQDGQTHERNLLVVIPGRDRSRAVLMADHYDTAYMYDHYDRHEGGNGARLSAPARTTTAPPPPPSCSAPTPSST